MFANCLELFQLGDADTVAVCCVRLSDTHASLGPKRWPISLIAGAKLSARTRFQAAR